VPTWATRGLRGSAFETLIDFTNRLYEQKGLAIIQKIPTPITPVEVSNKERTITSAYFEKKSTVDFIGVAQGVALAYDAKEIRELNLPLRNIHEHQIKFMEEFTRHKGISFLLVRFAAKNEIFLLPSSDLAKYYKDAAKGGRKSIPYDAFDSELLVQNSKSFPVHYLEAVNIVLKRREKGEFIC